MQESYGKLFKALKADQKGFEAEEIKRFITDFLIPEFNKTSNNIEDPTYKKWCKDVDDCANQVKLKQKLND